jgi:hypothetical protein
MRAREILQEDSTYNQNLESDLTNLLVGAKASGAKDVKTAALVKQLYSMGYSIDANSVLPLLSRNPAVLNATPDMITLTPPEGTMDVGQPGGQTQDSASQVSDMAQKANSLG